MEKNNSKERVLIMAPVGRDAQVHGRVAGSATDLKHRFAVRWQNAPRIFSPVQVRSYLRRKLSNWAAYRIYSKR